MALAWLYWQQREGYFAVMNLLGYTPYAHPFIDSEFMYAMKECWLKGVDVYVSVPCDGVAGNRMAYSPLWPRLWFLPADKAAFTVPVALVTDILAILSLLILPRARTPYEALILTLCVISPTVTFALERNNIDVWMYLVLCAVVLLLGRGPILRACGYGLILLAGLLKYYPFALFVLALRERGRVVALLAAAAVLALALFVWFFLPELQKSLSNLPAPSPFDAEFGVTDLPRLVLFFALGDGEGAASSAALWVLAGRLALTLLIAASALRSAFRGDHDGPFGAMPPAHRDWLCAGAVIVAGCYLAGANVQYRGIYLLAVVPGLLSLARHRGTGLRTLVAWPVLVCLLMWSPRLQRLAGWAVETLSGSDIAGMVASLAVIIATKIVWILLARLLLALVITHALASPTGRAVMARWRALASRTQALPAQLG